MILNLIKLWVAFRIACLCFRMALSSVRARIRPICLKRGDTLKLKYSINVDYEMKFLTLPSK